ncbi:MAG: hypothetical protein ACLQNE_21400 [Thermoguttaceae bacterium]
MPYRCGVVAVLSLMLLSAFEKTGGAFAADPVMRPKIAGVESGSLFLFSSFAKLADSPRMFRPGEPWLDDRGVPINAHGGGILAHEGAFYWFGQHMVEGNAGNYAQVGVDVYASKNGLAHRP